MAQPILIQFKTIPTTVESTWGIAARLVKHPLHILHFESKIFNSIITIQYFNYKVMFTTQYTFPIRVELQRKVFSDIRKINNYTYRDTYVKYIKRIWRSHLLTLHLADIRCSRASHIGE